jgi:uncharacterized protein YggL (DUF469 family)
MALEDLQQFIGGGDQYRHISGLLYTEGVRYVAEEGKAYWLIDAIASYQRDRRLRENARLQEFQLWELTVQDTHGSLTCREDTDLEPVVRQEIEFTDFPLPTIRFYVEAGVLLLPQEH